MYSTANNYRVSKRPMTEAESEGVDKVYKNAQKQARPAGFFALVFAAIGLFSGADTIDPSTPQGMSGILILVVGLLAFGLALNSFRIRKAVKVAHDNGYVVVVQGPVSRYNGKASTTALTVGPLSMGWDKRSTNQLQEGSFAEVACIPNLRSAVSINGSGLDQPIKVMMPFDLETKAATAPLAAPATNLTAGNPQTNVSIFCPRCGNPGAALAFCSNCGNKF